MAQYVVLANFTDQGIRAVKETTKRAKAFRAMAKSAGVQILEIYWTLGLYDVVLTMEAPDDEAMAALMLKAGSLGNLKSQTLRAWTETELDPLLAKL